MATTSLGIEISTFYVCKITFLASKLRVVLCMGARPLPAFTECTAYLVRLTEAVDLG